MMILPTRLRSPSRGGRQLLLSAVYVSFWLVFLLGLITVFGLFSGRLIVNFPRYGVWYVDDFASVFLVFVFSSSVYVVLNSFGGDSWERFANRIVLLPPVVSVLYILQFMLFDFMALWDWSSQLRDPVLGRLFFYIPAPLLVVLLNAYSESGRPVDEE